MARKPDFFGGYDGAWKDGFKRHLRLNLEIYFPKIARLIDWNVPPVWMDKEIARIVNRPGKKNRPVDLLVRLRLKKGGDLPVLVHIEVQSEKDESFPERLHLYNAGIFYDGGYTVNDVREIYWLVDHMMQLNHQLSLQFESELLEFEHSKSMPYITSIERHALDRGKKEGKKRR